MTSAHTDIPGRGARTKAAILGAARQCFAREGYAGATIRLIAADAGVDPALVMRYFGNKETLFAAAAEFDLRLPSLAGLAPEEASRALLRHFLVRWEEDDTLMALVRAASTNAGAVAQLQAVFVTQVLPVVAALSGMSAEQAATRAGLVASQVLGMALGRYILQLPPLAALGHDAIVDWLAPTLERYIFGELPAEPVRKRSMKVR